MKQLLLAGVCAAVLATSFYILTDPMRQRREIHRSPYRKRLRWPPQSHSERLAWEPYMLRFRNN